MTIAFTEAASGGTAPLQHKWLLTSNNWQTYSVPQDWSPSNTLA